LDDPASSEEVPPDLWDMSIGELHKPKKYQHTFHIKIGAFADRLRYQLESMTETGVCTPHLIYLEPILS